MDQNWNTNEATELEGYIGGIAKLVQGHNPANATRVSQALTAVYDALKDLVPAKAFKPFTSIVGRDFTTGITQ